MLKAVCFTSVIIIGLMTGAVAHAASPPDADRDGLVDAWEVALGTDPAVQDSDSDGYLDGQEVRENYDPRDAAPVKREKRIEVDLSAQRLKVYFGNTLLEEIKISSGLPRMPTPAGEFKVIEKKPLVHYRGPGYDFPRTKWNLMFKRHSKGSYYIHGAYWHNKFGRPMSHGCVNISYADIPRVYEFAQKGTKVVVYGKTPTKVAREIRNTNIEIRN